MVTTQVQFAKSSEYVVFIKKSERLKFSVISLLWEIQFHCKDDLLISTVKVKKSKSRKSIAKGDYHY